MNGGGFAAQNASAPSSSLPDEGIGQEVLAQSSRMDILLGNTLLILGDVTLFLAATAGLTSRAMIEFKFPSAGFANGLAIFGTASIVYVVGIAFLLLVVGPISGNRHVGAFDPATIEIVDEGLMVTTDKMRHVIRWSAVAAVVRSKWLLQVVGRRSGICLVPRRAFVDEEAYSAFEGRIWQQIETNRPHALADQEPGADAPSHADLDR